MSRKHKVIWTDTASLDLHAIISFIKQDSVDNAIKILHKIKTNCERLYTYPNCGRIVPELKEYGITLYRELITDVWRIMYRITDRNVYILSVIDSRQNVEDILLNRFVNKL